MSLSFLLEAMLAPAPATADGPSLLRDLRAFNRGRAPAR